MPFLRAALLKKKAKPEEEKNLQPPVAELESEYEHEPDAGEFSGIENLHSLIDEKAKLFEEHEHENENAEFDSEHTEVPAEPEMVSGVTENICVSESDSDGNTIQAVQEEAQEQQEESEIESEPEQETSELESESETAQEELIESEADYAEQQPESEHEQEQPTLELEQEELTEPEAEQPEQEPEAELESESESEHETSEHEPEQAIESESVNEEIELDDTEQVHEDVMQEVQPEDESKSGEHESESEHESGEFKLKYDFTSGERYVDSVSTKTEFDKMLDELSAISGELQSHEVEKFAKAFTEKFQGDFDKAESDAKKYEAFLGGYITNAAMILYDNGYRDTAIKRLDQAKSILEARKKLEDETAAIKTRVEEENDSVDLSDILGLFGD